MENNYNGNYNYKLMVFLIGSVYVLAKHGFTNYISFFEITKSGKRFLIMNDSINIAYTNFNRSI